MTTEDRFKNLLVIVVGLGILHLIFKLDGLLYAALGIGFLSLLIPIAGEWIVKGWMKLAEILGYVNSRILLTAIFFLILFPLAVLFRLSGKNPLNLKKLKGDSVFTERNHTYCKKDLEDIF